MRVEDPPDDLSEARGELARLRRRLAREQAARREAETIAEAALRDLYHHQRKLQEAEERFRTAFEDAPIGMALVGIDGRWLEVNRSLCEITGYSREQLLLKGFNDLTLPEDIESDRHQAQRLRDGEIPGYRIEKRFVHADGHPVWVSFSASLVRVGEDRDPLYLITQVEDVSQRKQLEQQLEHLAQSDPLTALYNRRRFDDELDRVIQMAARYGRPAALLTLDVDNFKGINDTYGHKAGDDVLTAVAMALRSVVRSTDIAARLGGDEFAALLPESDLKAASCVAGRLAAAVRQIEIDGTATTPTASIGIAILERRQSAEKLLVAADGAMYAAKHAGGDGYAITEPASAS